MALSEVEGEFDCAGKGEHSRRKELVQDVVCGQSSDGICIVGQSAYERNGPDQRARCQAELRVLDECSTQPPQRVCMGVQGMTDDCIRERTEYHLRTTNCFELAIQFETITIWASNTTTK